MLNDREIDKEDVVYVYYGILLSHKKWINVICSNMDGHRDCHTEWYVSHKGKSKYHIKLLICRILKKWYKWIYLWKRNRVTDVKTNLWLPGEKWRGRINWAFDIDIIHTTIYKIGNIKTYCIAQGTLFNTL